MGVLWQIVWAVMMLLFLAGAVTYAFRPHAGMDLLKRAAVLLGVLLIGPSLVYLVLSQTPLWLLVLIGVGASLAAYRHLSESSSHKDQRRHGASSAHAERHPRLPHESGGQEHS